MFFVISRRNIDSNNEFTTYFKGFLNRYDIENETEEYGIEEWTECDGECLKFETFQEAFGFYKVFEPHSRYEYCYSIDLCRKTTEKDIEERKGNCGDFIPLKTFYCSSKE